MAMESRAKIIGLRSRAPAVVLAAVLSLIFFLLCYLLLSGYRDQIRKAEVGTRNIATLLQTQLYETLRRTDADLSALAAEFPEEALDAAAAPRFQQDIGRRLSGRLINAERMYGLYVADAAGSILYSSTGIPASGLNVSERAYFAKLRADPDAGLVFSDVLRSGATNRDVLVVARAIRNGGGRFLGAVLSPLDLVSLKNQLAALDVGKSGYVAMRRRDDHALIARWPDAGAEAGRPGFGSEHPFVRALAAGSTEATVADGGGDEPELKNHIASFKALPNYPFYFVVGFDRRAVLAGWYAQAALVGLSVLVVIAMLGGLLRRLGRMREREVVILSDLAQSESKFSELVQMLPVGVARFDLAGQCVFVNDRNELITGRSRDALLGDDWAGMIHPDDRRKIGALWRGKAEDSAVRVGEYRLVRPGGEIVHVMGEAKAEKNAAGVVVGHIVAQTDISLLKKAESELILAKQQAEQANQAKTRFLTTASHDLRQPIQAINLFKDALCRTELDEEQKTIARFLSLSVDALSGLLYSLLDISKLDAGLVRPQIRKVEVESVFEAVDDEFSSLAKQRNLRFKFFYPFNGPVLETDPGLLLSVLRNLIDNAFKYTRSGGVLIGFRRRGALGVIQVWDTGIGIDAVFGDRLFDECFQIGNAAGDRAKGLGIGLSIARRTARLLGGDVTYRSRLGRGSVFEITVPVCAPSGGDAPSDFELDEPSSSEVDYARFKGWDVVVVEDDPVVAKSIEMSLQAVGVSVECFASAEDALQAPSLPEADFYISDFVLPGINGIEFLDAIQRRSEIPINAILMTGEISSARMKSANRSGWRVVVKPAGLVNLLSIMAEEAGLGGAARPAPAGIG